MITSLLLQEQPLLVLLSLVPVSAQVLQLLVPVSVSVVLVVMLWMPSHVSPRQQVPSVPT